MQTPPWSITTQAQQPNAQPAVKHRANYSLANLIQSQNTMFTQAIHQMDALAECQAMFKNNTKSTLETISHATTCQAHLAQLELPTHT